MKKIIIKINVICDDGTDIYYLQIQSKDKIDLEKLYKEIQNFPYEEDGNGYNDETILFYLNKYHPDWIINKIVPNLEINI